MEVHKVDRALEQAFVRAKLECLVDDISKVLAGGHLFEVLFSGVGCGVGNDFVEVALGKAGATAHFGIDEHFALRKPCHLGDVLGILDVAKVGACAKDVAYVGGVLLVGNCHATKQRCNGVVQNDNFAIRWAMTLDCGQSFRADKCADNLGSLDFLAECARFAIHVGLHIYLVGKAKTDVGAIVQKVGNVLCNFVVELLFCKKFVGGGHFCFLQVLQNYVALFVEVANGGTEVCATGINQQALAWFDFVTADVLQVCRNHWDG